jgi:hypothetical protein
MEFELVERGTGEMNRFAKYTIDGSIVRGQRTGGALWGTRIVWVSIALVPACVGPVYEGKFDYERGWRVAKVTHAGGADADFQQAARDCRAELPVDAVRGRKFARVAFTSARHYQTVIARAAPGYSPQPEDLVYVNAEDCGRDLEKTAASGNR